MPKGNPEPDLQGWADRSKPGWQNRALERVQARQKAKGKRRYERRDGVRVDFDTPFRVYLDEACMRRGLSFSGYARRALAAFIAYDLGVPITEVLKHTAYPLEYHPDIPRWNGAAHKTSDNGTGYGEWRITGLECVENADDGATEGD